MPRSYPLPDFRYVGLQPSRSSAAGALALAASSACVAGLCALGAPSDPAILTLALGAGGVSAAVGALALGRLSSSGRSGQPRAVASSGREVAMAIVPWGVLLTPDTEPRFLRWAAVRDVSVELTHVRRGGVPQVLASRVTVRTERELFAGRAPGAVDLESLVANLGRYAEESARPASADLEGQAPLESAATEPVVAELFRIAQDLCVSAQGATRLGLAAPSYRSMSHLSATPEACHLLRGVLGAGPELPCDPRPLAAIVASALGAAELVPELLQLVSSPHPIVAAVAKASALRLGAPPARAGAVSEVDGFLFEEDRELLERWADPASGRLADAAHPI